MARRVDPIPKTTKLKKDNLREIINTAVEEINLIHDLYEKYLASAEGKASLLDQIESKLSAISTAYSDLFESTDPNKVATAKQALGQIKAYHDELLNGDKSIKADIKDSQQKINAFYDKLFFSSGEEAEGETEDGGRKAIVEAAIKSITDFDARLNNTEIGYKFKIEAAKKEILDAHADLFKKDTTTGQSVSDQLKSEIVKAHAFHTEVKTEIAPYLKEKREEITDIARDIKNKQADVDSLLSNATAKALAEGYLQSMQIYGSPIVSRFPKRGDWRRTLFLISLFWNHGKHFLKFVGSYALFIAPLILIGTLFVVNNGSILGVNLATKDVKFSGTEYIAYKLTIGLPLLWVSWFGQRSISHRRRLFEEYNHKLRVVQMYMHFTANTYSLSKKTQESLEKELIETIARNPGHVYGKDETMLDKLIELLPRKKNEQPTDATK